MPQKLLPALIVLVSVVLFSLALVEDARAATIKLAPSEFTLTQTKEVTVRIKLDTQGELANAVTAALTYPQDQLEAVSLSYATSAFPVAVEASYGGGLVWITRGSTSGIKGVVDVATVIFRGKSSGSGEINIQSNSQIARFLDSSNALDLSSSTGSSFSVSPAPGKTVTQEINLLVSDLVITPLATDSAIVSWKTDKAANSLVEYGLDEGKYVLSASDKALVTEHRIKLQSQLFSPGVRLHLKVTSQDKAGNVGISADTTFIVKGSEVRIKVVDQANKPIENARVVVYSQPAEALTNREGEAVFTDLTPGKHLVLIKVGNFEKYGEITIAETTQPQIFGLMVDQQAPKTGQTSIINFDSNNLNLALGAFSFLMVVFWLLMHKIRSVPGTKVVAPNIPHSS